MTKEKQTLILLNEILNNAKEFDTNKVINFEELEANWRGLESSMKSKDLFNNFRNYLLNSNNLSKSENQCKSEILDGSYHKIKKSFPKRLEEYHKQSK